MYDTATPYAASYLIIRKGDTIAFVLRENTSWMNGYYGLPSGKVEKRELFTECAVREGNEEVGITIQPENLRPVHTCQRVTDSEWVDIYFEVLEYEGDVINAEPHMHGEVAWLNVHNLPDNVIPSTNFALTELSKGLAFSEYRSDSEFTSS